MKDKFETKPFTTDEKERINSAIHTNEVAILFYSGIALTLLLAFISGLFKAKDIYAILLVLFFIGVVFVLYILLIKGMIADNKQSKKLLSRNEKYCSTGRVTSKWQKQRKYTNKSIFIMYYIEIDNEVYQTSQKDFLEFELGDYVYYEIKEPLFPEIQKIRDPKDKI